MRHHRCGSSALRHLFLILGLGLWVDGPNATRVPVNLEVEISDCLTFLYIFCASHYGLYTFITCNVFDVFCNFLYSEDDVEVENVQYTFALILLFSSLFPAVYI